MPVDIYQTFIDRLLQATANASTIFAPEGMAMFRAFAVIMTSWVGIQMALSGNFDMARIAKFVIGLSFGFALCNYYSSAIPGIGHSLPGLISSQTYYMTQKIQSNDLGAFFEAVKAQILGSPAPGALDPLGIIEYLVYTFVYIALTAVTYGVSLYGIIAQRILLILGPFFVPFFIVPKLEFLFWGWLKAYLQFSFYQVVAACMVTVVAGTFKPVIAAASGGTLVGFVGQPSMLIITCWAVLAIWLMLKVPAISSSLFSGSAGSDDGGFVGLVSSAGSSVVSAGEKAAAAA